MNILPNTIHSLSKEEVINYKLYANRTRKEHNRKDILLFDLLKKKEFSDANNTLAFNKLYPNATTKNTYHRLKSRLLKEIDSSIIQFYFHKTDAHFIYNEICLYKTYIQKSEWTIALYHLKKAEKKAAEIHDYLMLEVIYTEYINLSVQYGNLAPGIYIEKRTENSARLKDLRILDDAIANIIYDVKQSQNVSKTNVQKYTVLNKAIRNINSKKGIKNNIAFKSKLYSAICNLLLTQKDYITLEQYAITTYLDFNKNSQFAKHNHNIKLQMLMYICNTLFINKKHALALEYIQKLKTAMHEFKNTLYDNYVFFYYNSLANNYLVINPSKTIVVLNEARSIKAIKNHPTHLGYIYLNLAGAYIELYNYKAALKSIINLYQYNVFENLGQSIKLNIRITEIVLHIETLHLDYASQLIKTVLKQDHVLLITSEYKQDHDFLILLQKIISKSDLKKDKKATEWVLKFQNTTYKYDSNAALNYQGWLEEKYSIKT